MIYHDSSKRFNGSDGECARGKVDDGKLEDAAKINRAVIV